MTAFASRCLTSSMSQARSCSTLVCRSCSAPTRSRIYLGYLFKVIREYDDFSPDNDPYGEHDFGAFTFQSQKCFWKLDYYATDMCSGAEDPADKYKSLRVLTVMLGSEY